MYMYMYIYISLWYGGITFHNFELTHFTNSYNNSEQNNINDGLERMLSNTHHKNQEKIV